MRGSRTLLVVLVVAIVGIGVLIAWIMGSHASEIPTTTLPPVAPRTEATASEVSPVPSETSSSTRSELGSREEALATSPTPKHAKPRDLATVRVHVFDAVDTTTKLDGIVVELINVFGDPQKVTSAEGNEVTFAEVEPGEYRVRASATDHSSGLVKTELKPGERSKDVTLGIPRALRLTVRWVTRDGAPLLDAVERAGPKGVGLEFAVFATYMPPNASEMPWTTNVGGLLCTTNGGGPKRKLMRQRNGFDDINSHVGASANNSDGTLGVMIADATPPFFVGAWFGEMLVDAKRIDPDVKEVVFTSDPEQLLAARGTLKLRVVESARASPSDAGTPPSPIVGASIRVIKQDDSPSPAVSDAEGRFVMAGIAPGKALVEISAEGRDTHTEEVFLRAGEITDLGDVALEGPTTIRVHTVDEQGKPVNVLVGFAAVDEHMQRLVHAGPDESVWSGAAGLALLEHNVRHSRYVISLGPDPLMPILIQTETLAAAPVVVDATSEPAEATMIVHPSVKIAVDFEALPEVGTLARVVTPDGALVRSKLVPPSGHMSFALAPGKYRLDLFENGSLIPGAPFTVGDTSYVLAIGR